MASDPSGGGGPDSPRVRGRRAVTDYGSTMLNWLHNFKPRWEGGYAGEYERPGPQWITKMTPPAARVACGADSVPTKHLHASLNKAKHPINVVRWTPEGRRLLTASTSGEFTLWNGTGFNFETIMQAHDSAIRAVEWTHSGDWLVSGDHDGFIKYWQANFNNVQSIRAHDQPIRDLAFSPNDTKFVTASDDSALKLFDFAAGAEEGTLDGHGWDVKSVDWHPTKSLVVSGSKDHLIKLWDPRARGCISTLRAHKNTITKVQFERVRGMCFATSARDPVPRVFDLRMMRDIVLLKGHERDVSTLAFHPIHPMLLTTGCQNGAVFHYLLDEQHPPEDQPPTVAVYDAADPMTASAQNIWPAHKVPFAHEMAVWTLDWHPIGHILASGSNDRITRFWTRARPGDLSYETDRYHVGGGGGGGGDGEGRDRRSYAERARARVEEELQDVDDEADALVDQNRQPPGVVPGLTSFPGLGLTAIPGLPLHAAATASSAAPAVFGIPLGRPPPSGAGTGAAGAGGRLDVPPPFPFPPPGFDPSRPPVDLNEMAQILQRAGIKLPPPGSLPPGMVPPPPPPGFPMPVGMPGADGGANEPNRRPVGGVRRRGPLPTQEESLRMEQSKGKYTRPR